MKYIIEDNINFFDELNNDDCDSNNTCLIENKPLVDNFITLSCGHKFNYLPIYNEIIKQKTKYNPNETTKLKINQIKCPYCRQITNNLLPYIPCIKETTKVTGVNTPSIHCLKHKQCSWIYKSGKNKGICCNSNGFTSSYGNLCIKHWDIKNKKICENHIIDWTDEMKTLYENNTVKDLKKLLKDKGLTVSGKKKDLVIRYGKNM